MYLQGLNERISQSLEDFLSCELKARVIFICIYIADTDLKAKVPIAIFKDQSLLVFYILFFLLEYVIK